MAKRGTTHPLLALACTFTAASLLHGCKSSADHGKTDASCAPVPSMPAANSGGQPAGASTSSAGTRGLAGRAGSAGARAFAGRTGSAGTRGVVAGVGGSAGARVSAAGSGGASVGVRCSLGATPPSGALRIDVNGQQRDYIVVLPDGYDGSTNFPLLFAFHGTGSTGADFVGQYYADITRMVAGRALIVAPTGLVDTEGEYAGMTRWQLTNVDRGLFDTLLAQLKADYCIDEHRVFATGHSAGAYFTNFLGCTRGDVLRGIAPISGGGPFDPNVCVGHPAVLVGHNPHECKEVGANCPYAVPWAITGWTSTQYWTTRDGCADPNPMPTEPFSGTPPCMTYPGCMASAPVRLCLYDYSTMYSGPHAWPVPWLAKEIMDFFLGLPPN